MKKLFLIELILILIVLCSCSTVDNETLIHDYMLQAEDSYLNGDIEKSVSLCQEGFNKTGNSKLLYNQAVYMALIGNYYEAYELSTEGFEKFPDDKKFAEAALEYLKIGDYPDLLYRTALSFWRNGMTDLFVVSALNSVKPEEWGILYSELTAE